MCRFYENNFLLKTILIVIYDKRKYYNVERRLFYFYFLTTLYRLNSFPSEKSINTLLNQFSAAYSAFGLTISLKKTEVLSQWTDTLPSIKIIRKHIEKVKKNFVYLGSNAASNASLDTKIKSRIGKASDTLDSFTAKFRDD